MVIICAILASAMATSCANTDELNDTIAAIESEQTNTFMFDSEENETTEGKLYRVCIELLEVHLQFDYFRAALPEDLGMKMRNTEKVPSLDDMVEVIYRWWANDECYDVMCEYPTWDDFKELLPQTKYAKKYDFLF